MSHRVTLYTSHFPDNFNYKNWVDFVKPWCPGADLNHRHEDLLDLLSQPKVWPLAYLHWELELLSVLGYGLDLSKCAVSGCSDNLRYVSPRTGRAISEQAAGVWAPKLLNLPPIILKGSGNSGSIIDGLKLTGYFLTKKVFNELSVNSPVSERQRFVDLLTQKGA